MQLGCACHSSANLCFLIGVLNLFIFNIVTEKVRFMSAIWLFVFYMPYVFFVPLFLHYCLLLFQIKTLGL